LDSGWKRLQVDRFSLFFLCFAADPPEMERKVGRGTTVILVFPAKIAAKPRDRPVFGPKKACHGLQRLFQKKALPNHYKLVIIAAVASDNDLSWKLL
jgi:hypothetical protein